MASGLQTSVEMLIRLVNNDDVEFVIMEELKCFSYASCVEIHVLPIIYRNSLVRFLPVVDYINGKVWVLMEALVLL